MQVQSQRRHPAFYSVAELALMIGHAVPVTGKWHAVYGVATKEPITQKSTDWLIDIFFWSVDATWLFCGHILQNAVKGHKSEHDCVWGPRLAQSASKPNSPHDDALTTL